MQTTRIVPIMATTCLLVACAPTMKQTSSVNGPKSQAVSSSSSTVSVEQARPAPSRIKHSADEDKYLASLHKLVQPRWQQVLVNAGALLPRSHPANLPSRMTELEVHLDQQGQLKRIRVRQSSGCNPYDNSALATLARIGKFPGLPASLQKGHVELRWRFHRDQRASSPDFARVVLHPLTPEEDFTRALKQQDWKTAQHILRTNRHRPTVISILVEAGLSAKNVQLNRMALRLAPLQRLLAVLENETSLPRWKEALTVLASRKGSSQIADHLRWVARPVSRINRPATEIALEAAKIAALLQTLNELGARAPEAVVRGLMLRKEAAVVLAASSMTADAALVSSALETFVNDPTVAGPLAVHRLALGQDARAAALATAALGHARGRAPTMAALRRTPVRSLVPRVEAMVRSSSLATDARVDAIRTLGKLVNSPVPFYVALLSPEARVQVAAIHALGQFSTHKTSISYRLTNIGLNNNSAVGAEALAAVARVGVERFLADVNHLSRRRRAPQRALVVGSFWGFGKTAVPMLSKLVSHKDHQVRQAAKASLARIQGKADPAAGPHKVADPLAHLMQQALASMPKASAPMSSVAAAPSKTAKLAVSR